MGRYRPPRPPSSNYITPAGKQRLLDELHDLWKVRRPQVTQSVREAAAQGDRSENAEYIYGKKQLREIDARVRHLRKRLDQLITVEGVPDNVQRVYFGAWVQLCADGRNAFEIRIVGPDEFDRQPNYVSMDAPMAQALLGKSLHEEVTVELPDGTKTLEITQIQYRGE